MSSNENQAPQQMELFAELLQAAAPAAASMVDAICDIPDQLELLSRATLARSFISPSKTGEGYTFDIERFERAWAAICPAYESAEMDPETDQNK
jgi:hypothetical protein